MTGTVESPLDRPLQQMGIRRLDVPRIRRDYRKTHGKDAKPKLVDLIGYMVDAYNAKQQAGGGESTFTPFEIPAAHWRPTERNGFRIKGYRCVVHIESSLLTMLGELGVETEAPVELSFLFILRRVKDSAAELFALTAGNRGYAPVESYSDYSFPRTIAIRLLNPEERSSEKAQGIIGDANTSDVSWRKTPSFDPNQLHKIYLAFKSRLRRDASLLALGCFRNADRTVPAKPAEFEIQLGALKISMQLPLSDYPPILEHFSKIARGEPTYRYRPKTRKKTREVDASGAFSFLNYYTSVAPQTYVFLEDYLSQKIAEGMKSGELPDLDLCPSHVKDYFRATQFRMRYQREGGAVISAEWSGHRKTFPEFIALLREVPHLNVEAAGLKRELKRVCLDYRTGRGWVSAPLLDCVTGEILVKQSQGHRVYFKLNRRWLETSVELLAKVDEEFRAMLSRCLLSPEDEGHLSHPWDPKGLQLTRTQAAQKLEVPPAKLDEILATEVSYVGNSGKVRKRKFAGEILQHPVISHFHEPLEELLEKDRLSLEEVRAVVGEAFAQAAWNELIRSRSIGEIRQITKKGTTRDIIQINTPFFLPRFGLRKQQKAKLNQWADIPLFSMDEGEYNETYLYTVKNGGQLYQSGENGWLVGDRICPEGIELFDLVQFTADRKIYIYHVKESFGQKTRDACSQLQNSARLLNGDMPNILNAFFDLATRKPKRGEEHSEYRTCVRTQLLAIGREAFLALFTEAAEIHFVYAFVDDRATEYRIDKAALSQITFSEEDFAVKKIGDRAKEVFDDLVESEYLLDTGEPGSKFRELHSFEALSFQDESLASLKKSTWKILAGDVGHFTSLIGRLDLLHTGSQIEGMRENFHFRVDQIPRPFDRDRTLFTPTPLSFEGMDEALSQQLQETREASLLFYHPPWGDQAECWTPQETLGDGSCAFHSVLGVLQNGVYQCADPETAREAFAEALKFRLNEAENGFTDDTLQDLYEANFQGLIREVSCLPDDEEDPGYLSASQVFPNGIFPEALLAKQAAVEAAILGKITPRSNLLKVLKKKASASGKNADFLERMQNNPRFYSQLIAGCPDELTELGKTGAYKKWLPSEVKKLKKVLRAKETRRQELLEDPGTMESFLEALTSMDYWLTTDEVQMLGYLQNLRVEIATLDVLSGDYSCSNAHTLPPRAGDERELILIHADGIHYSRCHHFGT